jgi:hypothetical protein
MGQSPTRLVLARWYLYRMLLRPEYLPKTLPSPSIQRMAERCAPFRMRAPIWARSAKSVSSFPTGSRKLILEEPDVTALSWQFRLAVLKDAKIDVSKTPAE